MTAAAASSHERPTLQPLGRWLPRGQEGRAPLVRARVQAGRAMPRTAVPCVAIRDLVHLLHGREGDRGGRYEYGGLGEGPNGET